MSAFWSAWIMLLIVVNLGITVFLFLWGTRVPIPTEPDGTTGHVWAHGVLREGVRRLPRWWYAMSGSMFVLGIGYLALFPGFGSFKGLLGWTSQGEHAQARTGKRLVDREQCLSLWVVQSPSVGAHLAQCQNLPRRAFDVGHKVPVCLMK